MIKSYELLLEKNKYPEPEQPVNCLEEKNEEEEKQKNISKTIPK